jgi:hypothetical protein
MKRRVTYVRFDVTVDKPVLVALFNGEDHLQRSAETS